MSTKPMPVMGEDPSVTAGQQVRADFTDQAQKLRQDQRLTDLQAAEQITQLWSSSNASLAKLYEDLQSRRRARLAALDSIVPLGPNVPAGASPADAAVLQQAFRSALAQARAAMPASSTSGGGNLSRLGPVDTDTLDGMLADAERFDDDNLRRAVLTAAYEGGYMGIVRRWSDLMGVTAQLDEYTELQDALAGQGIWGQWNYTTFAPLPAPDEVANLPRLQAAQEVTARVRAQASRGY